MTIQSIVFLVDFFLEDDKARGASRIIYFIITMIEASTFTLFSVATSKTFGMKFGTLALSFVKMGNLVSILIVMLINTSTN